MVNVMMMRAIIMFLGLMMMMMMIQLVGSWSVTVVLAWLICLKRKNHWRIITAGQPALVVQRAAQSRLVGKWARQRPEMVLLL
jgi:hypothetical protein